MKKEKELISLDEAFKNSAYKTEFIAKQFGFHRTYYSRFVSRKKFSIAEIEMIEKITQLHRTEIDIEVK